MRSFSIITGLGLALMLRAMAQDGLLSPDKSVTGTTPTFTPPAVAAPAAPAANGLAPVSSQAPVEITADGETTYVGGIATASDNVVIRHGGDLLYADQVSYDMARKTAMAQGNVRIYSGTRVYRGEHVTFNFETKAFSSTDFSFAAFPVFAKGKEVSTPEPGHYHLVNAYVTTDNRAHPSYRVKAHTIEIYPDDRVVLKDVVFLVGDVPVFYVPYYSQSLKSGDSTVMFRGGDSSLFGLTGQLTINWRVSDDLAAAFHEDYRSKRGEAGGLDLKYRPVPGGSGFFRGYWADDKGYTYNPTSLPRAPIDKERYLFTLQQTTPLGDGLEAKINLNVWSDPYITEDFFEKYYAEQRMPDNTVEVVDRFPDFEFSVLGRAQLNRFFDTTERAPEVRLESKPIKVFNTGIEYQTENSLVNFQQMYSNQQYSFPPAPTPNGLPLNYSAYRWDTYHQLLYPRQYFDFLSVVPHVGIRGTAWSNDNENLYTTGRTESLQRGTVDAGADFSFKISRAWTDAKNGTLAIDGIRHVVEPFVNAEAVLPSVGRDGLLGFDTRTPNTWANPIGFPAYNSIDSIDRQFVIRQGIRNAIQTKRDGQNWELLDWSLFSDLNLTSHYDEEQVYTHDAYSHIYSDATLKPFPWLRFNSRAAVDITGNSYNMLDHSVTWQPDRSFQLSLGDRLLRRAAPTLVDPYGYRIDDSNLVYIRTFYRMNEHWQFETIHQFDTDDSQLQEQSYTVYRDLSAWQLGVTLGQRNNRDAKSEEMVYFTLTLKAFPVASLRATE